MTHKQFVDFTFDEMTKVILEKEPYLEDLRRKALILLRGSITAIGRIQVVADVRFGSQPDVFKIFRSCMEHVSIATTIIDNYDGDNKKAPFGEEALSNSIGEINGQLKSQ